MSTSFRSGFRRQHRVGFACAVFLALALAGPTGSAAEPQGHRRRPTEAADPAAYWTPERMREARPMPMPEPAPGLAGLAEESPPPGEPVESAPAIPPVVTPAELDAFLADQPGFGSAGDADEADEAPMAEEPAIDQPSYSGTSGCHFSSSRLNPRTIDLKFPYRAVGKLFFTQPGVGNFVCSGAVLRQRVVLTAGHCVHSGNGAVTGWFSNFLFCPAYRGGQSRLGCWSWSWVITTGDWYGSGGVVPNAADYAMLEVPDQVVGGVTRRIGDVTGTFGYATSSLSANHVHMLGYPVGFSSGERMHQVAAGRCVSGGTNTERYGGDMRGGSSGGPWVQDFGVPASGQTVGPSGPNLIVGVMSYTNNSSDPKYEGSSIPDSRFSGILSSICNRDVTAPANCS